MSFAKRMRADRRTGSLVVAAFAAALGMAGLTATPAVRAADALAPSQQASREFTNPTHRAKRRGETKRNVLKKSGGGWDSRKARRRLIMQIVGIENTGRQWVRVRRKLRWSTHAWALTLPAWKLQRVVDAMRAKGVLRRAA